MTDHNRFINKTYGYELCAECGKECKFKLSKVSDDGKIKCKCGNQMLFCTACFLWGKFICSSTQGPECKDRVRIGIETYVKQELEYFKEHPVEIGGD